MRMRSIAARLAIMFGLAAAIGTIIGGIALYAFQADQLRRHKLEELAGRFVIVERMVLHNVRIDSWPKLIEKLDDFTPTDGKLRFLVDSADPRFRIGGDFIVAATMSGPREGYGEALWQGETFVTMAKTIAASGERPDVRLIIAVSRADVDHAQWVLALGIALISLCTLVSVSCLGWVIARRGLAPVDHLSDHASHLGADLSLRLPTARLPAELEGLVLALNGALDRLQQSYVRLSTFNADVAHELRTPLGNLIGETQVALSRARPVLELEGVLQSNLEELERLRTIINNMLFLARADQGGMANNLVTTSLAAEVRKSAEFMDMVFEDAGVSLAVEGDAAAPIERSLFGIAITNLFDNAVRHGEPGGAVKVAIAQAGGEARISVWNASQPFDEEALGRIFDRFSRLDPARSDSRHSHGLGLAIVKAIAHMHGGTAKARYVEGGLDVTFTVALPAR